MTVIRAYASTDAVAVSELWAKVFGYADARNDPTRVLEHKLTWDSRRTDGHDGLLVAVVGGRVVGTLMVGYDGHRAWLYRMAVEPSCRKRGIGRALVAAAEQRLRAVGCVKINLQLHAHNESGAVFWARLGYADEPRISMGKDLTASVQV